nr:hypothetical protein [uncultured Trichococcus sp.]
MEYNPRYLNAIQDPELKQEYTDFVNTFPITTQHRIRPLAKKLRNLKLQDISWDVAVELINNPITPYTPDNRKCVFYMFEFLVYLSDNNKYFGRYADELRWNRDNFLAYIKVTTTLKMENLSEPNVSPLSFIRYKLFNKSDSFIVLKKPTKVLATLITEFLNVDSDEKKKKNNHNTMFNYFTESFIETNSIIDINDFTDDTFFKNFKYFNEVHKYSPTENKQNFLYILCRFYNYILGKLDSETKQQNFKLLDSSVLKYTRLINLLQNGYRIYPYSVYEEPPTYSKMILKENGMDRNSTNPKDSVVIFDNEFVDNTYLRLLYTQFFWKDQHVSFLIRKRKYAILREFLIELDKEKNKNEPFKIKAGDIYNFMAKLHSRSYTDGMTISCHGIIKSFLAFISSNSLMEVDNTLYDILRHKEQKSRGDNEAYTKEQIKILKEHFKKNYELENDEPRKLLYKLYYYILEFFSVSEIRLSSILDLEIDSLFMDGKDYKLRVNSKAVYDEKDEYVITPFIKYLFDEILIITEKLRVKADSTEKKYLFIYRQFGKEAIYRVRQDSFAKYLKLIFFIYKLPFKYLPPKAIRKYYQQQISDFVDSEGYDPILKQHLGKHSLSVHFRSYEKNTLDKTCFQEKQNEVGSIYLAGKIEKNNSYPKESTVQNGCGHCSLKKCNLKGNMDCLMCPNFIATHDCTYFFEQAIADFDKALSKELTNFERESIIQHKRLHQAYLDELILLQ